MRFNKCFPGFILVLFFSMLKIYCQDNLPRYWISFSDKVNTPFSIAQPEEFLSERAIDRRIRQNITITEQDLPVDPLYVDSLSRLGLQVINVSKWFNGALIATSNTELIDSIQKLVFIHGPAILVKPSIAYKSGISHVNADKFSVVQLSVPYGYSSSQIEMLHGEYFHQQEIEGEGILIAILDAGFDNADNISSLAHIWQEDKLITTKDFVKDDLNIFNSHSHGTLVFSIIAGIQENILYGSAPDAEFALIRTEDGNSEYLIEEYNWVCGAEFADSLGADIINSSLGYSLFDDARQNHSYNDLDGVTTPISVAANLAAAKGIVVVASAGNSGNDPWYRITAPADANNIITVGAVDSLGIITDFSSRGPSFDRRVKPDVCSQGLYTVGQYPDGSFVYAAGTSCSAPLITGMVACLWQVNRQADYLEVIDAFHKAGNQYFTPDSLYGYGIPDLTKSDQLLANTLVDSIGTVQTISIFPNPVHSYFYININQPEANGNQAITINIYDTLGRLCRRENRNIDSNNFILDFQDIQILNTGLYFLQVNLSGKTLALPFIKI